MIDETTQSGFCWNGEDCKVDGNTFCGNDTNHVFQLLLTAAKSSPIDASKNIVAVLTSISGPFSFVFYDALSSCVYFSRDRLGRRSLVRSAHSERTLVLSSVSSNLHRATLEVETDGIYRVNLRTSTAFLAELLPWEGAIPMVNQELPSTAPAPLSIAASTVTDVKRELSASLQ